MQNRSNKLDIDNIESEASKQVQQLEGKLKNLSSKLTEFSSKGQAAFNDGKEKLIKTTKERPLTSLMVAGGVGILVGYLLGNRKK